MALAIPPVVFAGPIGTESGKDAFRAPIDAAGTEGKRMVRPVSATVADWGSLRDGKNAASSDFQPRVRILAGPTVAPDARAEAIPETDADAEAPAPALPLLRQSSAAEGDLAAGGAVIMGGGGERWREHRELEGLSVSIRMEQRPR